MLLKVSKFLQLNKLFFASLAAGLLIWLITFFLIPVSPSETFKSKTYVFLLLGYLGLIAGYSTFKFSPEISFKNHISQHKIIWVLIALIVISYVLRWVDLFYIRELSLDNEVFQNRALNKQNAAKSSLIFILASIFKSLYFFPFVLLVKNKLKKTSLISLMSFICLLLPMLEAYIRGSRRPFFEIFLIVVVTLFVFKKTQIKFKRMVVLAVSFILVATMSTSILFKRETFNDKIDHTFYELILRSKYNDILKPKEHVHTFFKRNDVSGTIKFYALTGLHIGQYITHGVFEFNHIIDKNTQTTYGGYTFVSVIKFINKLNIVSPIKQINPSPRKIVYLTAFGSLYLDFKWLTIPFLFCFGIVQRYIFEKNKSTFIYTPIFIYCLIINVFLLMLNYIKGAGIYPFVAFFILLITLKITRNLFHEKSPST